jgi:glycosyltransferase involved in cell wall biosynthesis
MKKNIFFLLPVFTYGAGQSIKRIILELDSRKYSKSIICLGKCQYKDELKNRNIKIFELNYSKLIFAMKDIANILKKDEGIQKILISNIHYTNILSLVFLSKIEKLKIIITERTALKELDIYFGFLDYIKKKIIKMLIIIYYRKANAIVTNSTKSSKDLNKIIGIKVKTIFSPSYIPTQIFKKKKIKNIKNLIVVSRLSKEKNILHLLKAINFIKNKNFILKIIGDGEQKKDLIAFVYKNNLSDKVKFLNYKKNVKKYLMQADLFINCSFFEGFPNSVVESLSCNVPVVCSKSHGGIFDILKKNQYGYLFDLDKVKKLTSLLLNFLENDKSFLEKTKNAKNNLKKFTIKNCVYSYESLIDNLK